MKHFRSGFFGVLVKDLLIPAAVCAVIIVLTVFSVNSAGANAESENAMIIEQGIRRAATACYAAEGIYPESIDYLVENYSLKIDTQRYNILYNSVASNVMPDIRVSAK